VVVAYEGDADEGGEEQCECGVGECGVGGQGGGGYEDVIEWLRDIVSTASRA
jgi:hypothetical protein